MMLPRAMVRRILSMAKKAKEAMKRQRGLKPTVLLPTTQAPTFHHPLTNPLPNRHLLYPQISPIPHLHHHPSLKPLRPLQPILIRPLRREAESFTPDQVEPKSSMHLVDHRSLRSNKAITLSPGRRMAGTNLLRGCMSQKKACQKPASPAHNLGSLGSNSATHEYALKKTHLFCFRNPPCGKSTTGCFDFGPRDTPLSGSFSKNNLARKMHR